MCLSALFSNQENILTFLQRASSKAKVIFPKNKKRESSIFVFLVKKKTKVEILQFLKFFIETAEVKILPHAVELKTVLLTIFNVDNASDVRASIFPVLSQVNLPRD
jgi:hypothetical protein